MGGVTKTIVNPNPPKTLGIMIDDCSDETPVVTSVRYCDQTPDARASE